VEAQLRVSRRGFSESKTFRPCAACHEVDRNDLTDADGSATTERKEMLDIEERPRREMNVDAKYLTDDSDGGILNNGGGRYGDAVRWAKFQRNSGLGQASGVYGHINNISKSE